MQQSPQNELTSYFQIGGIHGLPYVAWNAGNSNPVSDNGWQGYCVHGSVLFPTWHRPYMMLYEVSRVQAYIAHLHEKLLDILISRYSASPPEKRYHDREHLHRRSRKVAESRRRPPPAVLGLGEQLCTASRGDLPAASHDYETRWKSCPCPEPAPQL
jgi:hypothetical protein